MKRVLAFILVLVGVCSSMQAQKGLAIKSAFDELAVKENATEVTVGAGKLKKYHLSFFHSLEIKTPSAKEQQQVESLMQEDVRQAILYEENAGHKLYELPARGGLHRYIFYRCSRQSLILIYIEGKASLKQIKSNFLKTKN